MPPMVVKPLPVSVIAGAPGLNSMPRRLALATSLLEVAAADGPKVSCCIPDANASAVPPCQLPPLLQFPPAPVQVLAETRPRTLAMPYIELVAPELARVSGSAI